MLVGCRKDNPDGDKYFCEKSFDKVHYSGLNKQQKENYLDSIMACLSQKKRNSKAKNDYITVAAEYYYLSRNKKSYEASSRALRLATISKDTSLIAKSCYYIGDSFENTNRDSSYFYYLRAEKLYKKIRDFEQMARMKYSKAYVLFYNGNYLECEIEVSKALNYINKTDNYKLLYLCHTLMGNCLEKLEDYDASLRYHNYALKMLEILKKHNEDKDMVNNYSLASIINICILYDRKKEYDKSISLLEPLLTKDTKANWPSEYALIKNNLAASKMNKGDFKGVAELLTESLKISDSLHDKAGIVYSKIHLGEYFLLKKDTAAAYQYLKDALKISKEYGYNNEQLNSLSILSKISDENMHYKDMYINVNDSIVKQQRKTRDKYARIEYETSLLEDQNEALAVTNSRILIASGFIVLVLFALLMLKYVYSKNKELYYLRHQKLADEELSDLLNKQQERINLAKEHEKSLIAAELHDNVLNRLYGVRMNLGFFNNMNTDEGSEKRKSYILNLQEIEKEIRSLSHDLKKNVLEDSTNFTDLLKSLTEDDNSLGTTQFIFKCTDYKSWNNLENIYKINVYRIIQESLFNVHKHAEAKKCEVILSASGPRQLLLQIKDNGKGFLVNKKANGIGLDNIQQRIALIRGSLKIISSPGNGTTLQVLFAK
ncbi:MAG: ATP-binding protein [Flavobacterium sp.]